MSTRSKDSIGFGSTAELSLRVSAATLARVVVSSPTGGSLLALERKATLLPDQTGHRITVKVQPFGGAVRLLDPERLHQLVGDFHFDSQRSKIESDMRIYIRPSDWEIVRDFCLEQFKSASEDALELETTRELVEEFSDILGMDVTAGNFHPTPLWTVVENSPVSTANIHAADTPTVRIYRVFDVQVTDSTLIEAIIDNSHGHSDDDLRELAAHDAQRGGRGWANAALVLPIESLLAYYRDMLIEERNRKAVFDGHLLEPNVTALFEEIEAERYRRM